MISAVELTTDEITVLAVDDAAARLLDIVELDELVKLCAVVTSAVLAGASVEELVTAVLCEGFPVPTGLTYTVSVFDDCAEIVDVMSVLASEVAKVGATELWPFEDCP